MIQTVNAGLVLTNHRGPAGAPGTYRSGYYFIDGSFYVVRDDGRFVDSSGSYRYRGVEFSCSGPDGVCHIFGGKVWVVDGRWMLLDNGNAVTTPGLYDMHGALYCVADDGFLLSSGTYNTLQFGQDARYTSGNAQIDRFINSIILSVTDDSMEKEEKLRACFDYVFDNMLYLGNNNHVPRGADASTWTETYLLRYINQGNRGNCYCFSSLMYYLTRRIGYISNAISGGIDKNDYDHGWIDIEMDGELYIFDPELGRKWHDRYPSVYSRYRFFMMTYQNTPFPYVRY